MNKLKIKLCILIAFAIGMIQISLLSFIPRPYIPPFFSIALLVDVVLFGIVFYHIDKTK